MVIEKYGRDQGDALIYSDGVINRAFPCRDSVTREPVSQRCTAPERSKLTSRTIFATLVDADKVPDPSIAESSSIVRP